MNMITKILSKSGHYRGDSCMNLTELQIQLRSIAEHISELQVEIEKMKPQPEDEKKVIFEKITEMASKFPLENRRFSKAPMVDAKVYVSCLAYISLADDSKIYDKLLFLCRLSYGMGLPISSEDIFKMGLEVDEKYFDKACSELKDQKYAFLTDALILVNITEEATEASFRLITDIARIFECEKEDLRAAAMVAKAVLIEDFNVLKQIPVPSKNRWMGQFRKHIPSAWIELQRIKCGMICIEKKNMQSPYLHLRANNISESIVSCVVKNRMQAGSIVKKGEVLISYEEHTRIPKSEKAKMISLYVRTSPATNNSYFETVIEKKTIMASCDGVVFFIERNTKDVTEGQMEKHLEVYVVSYFDDYAEFSEWHKKN